VRCAVLSLSASGVPDCSIGDSTAVARRFSRVRARGEGQLRPRTAKQVERRKRCIELYRYIDRARGVELARRI
jgi:hypothetical protein